MPQIQMLEGVPSFGTQLAQNLGQGFNKGLEKGIASGLSGMLARKKEAKSVRTDIGKLVKQYEKGTFDPKTIQGFENRALELLNEGKVSSSLEATLAALVEFGQKKTENQPKAEVAGKEIASAKASPTQIPLNFLKEPKPQGFWNRVLQGTGQGAAMQAHALEQQREAIPQLAAGGIEGATLGFAKPLQPETEAGKLYRETGKLAGLGKTYGKIQQGIEKIAKPTSLLGKIATGSAAGATISSAQQLIEKGEIDPKQLGIDTAIWTGLEGLFVAAPQVMRYLKGSVETIAKETGKPAEEILNEAVKSSGADFEKVLTGDAKEINKISKDLTGEAEAVSKKVEKAPKEFFEPEKAIKHREKTAQKLPGSPLEEYFSVEKPITKRAETVVKETEMISKFQPLEKQMNTRLQAERDELRELMADRRGLEGNALERVNTNIIFKQRQIDKTLKDLKDLRYELKYFAKQQMKLE